MQDDLSLQPVRAGLPVLTFPHERKYWASLESGSIHALLLRKGGGGFYQIDMAPIYAKTRAFYDR